MDGKDAMVTSARPDARLTYGAFPRIDELVSGGRAVLTTPLLPAFSLALDELFA